MARLPVIIRDYVNEHIDTFVGQVWLWFFKKRDCSVAVRIIPKGSGLGVKVNTPRDNFW